MVSSRQPKRARIGGGGSGPAGRFGAGLFRRGFGVVAPPIAQRVVGLEFSVRVKTPRATVGGATGTASVIVWRSAVPAPMSPWNAPVALTIENKDRAVAGG